MAYVVSSLSNYTNPGADTLVSASIFSAKTAELIFSKGNVLSGVKSAENINVLSTDATFQAGGTCGFSASGSTTFTNRTLTIGKIKVQEALCPKSLESKYLQLKLKKGSTYDAPAFVEEYRELKAQTIAKQMEVAYWQGDTSSGTGNLSKFDGFIKLIDAVPASVIAANGKTLSGTITSTTGSTSVSGSSTAFDTEVAAGDKIYGNVSGTYTLIGTVSSVTNATTLVLTANGAVAVTAQAAKSVASTSVNFSSPISVATGITTSNVRTVIASIWRAIPAALKGQDDVTIFCGWDVYEAYIAALIEANLYHYTADNKDQPAGEILVPGTKYKIVAVHGLDSTNRLYAMRLSNMWIGVDMEHEEEKFEIFFAKEADEVRFMAEWKAGVQFAHPTEIVQFMLV